jgi:hypothetical protein
MAEEGELGLQLQLDTASVCLNPEQDGNGPLLPEAFP